MSRAPVFEAIKAARGGRSFTAAEVPQVDDLLDRLGVPRDTAAPAARLGALSERYESGGRGPGTVSTGVNDPGGVSYGLYQLASKTGTVGAFLTREGLPWRAELRIPGSPAFSAAWKAIAAREPERFAAAQHAFIERTHYRPAVDKVRAMTGVDLDTRAPAVRDAVWSVAVQHGRAADILADAVRAWRNGHDAGLIDAIYDARTGYVHKLLASASGGTASTFRTLINSRYPDERARAKAMLA